MKSSIKETSGGHYEVSLPVKDKECEFQKVNNDTETV